MVAAAAAAAAVGGGDPWGWVGPTATIVLALLTLLSTRLPEASRLRKLERLGALVKNLETSSTAHLNLQFVLDEEAAVYRAAHEAKPRRRAVLLRTAQALALTALVIVGVAAIAALATGGFAQPVSGVGLGGAVASALVGALIAAVTEVRSALAARKVRQLFLHHLRETMNTTKKPPASPEAGDAGG